MTASTDADELSPLALAAEDARPSLDDVLGPERKPSREGGRAFVGAGARRSRAEVAADHRHGIHRGESSGDVLGVETRRARVSLHLIS